MKYLVYTGTQDSGKTSSVWRLAHHFLGIGFELDPNGLDTNHPDQYGVPVIREDFYCLLKRNENYILCSTYSDYKKDLVWLKNYIAFLEDKGMKINLVVMTSRDPMDDLFEFTQATVGLTDDNRVVIPLARMSPESVRNRSIVWYMDSVFNLVVNRVLLQLFIDTGIV
jgi:glycosyltransferase involved in cell wall biosynthesis